MSVSYPILTDATSTNTAQNCIGPIINAPISNQHCIKRIFIDPDPVIWSKLS